MSQLEKEIKRFFVAGASAVATDLTVYYLLLLFLSHAPSKAISFIAGSIVAYIINKYWTFEKPDRCIKEAGKFVMLYTLTLMANVASNELVLWGLPEKIFFAFLVATGISTVLNFLGQKLWVFR